MHVFFGSLILMCARSGWPRARTVHAAPSRVQHAAGARFPHAHHLPGIKSLVLVAGCATMSRSCARSCSSLSSRVQHGSGAHLSRPSRLCDCLAAPVRARAEAHLGTSLARSQHAPLPRKSDDGDLAPARVAPQHGQQDPAQAPCCPPHPRRLLHLSEPHRLHGREARRGELSPLLRLFAPVAGPSPVPPSTTKSPPAVSGTDRLRRFLLLACVHTQVTASDAATGNSSAWERLRAATCAGTLALVATLSFAAGPAAASSSLGKEVFDNNCGEPPLP